MLQTKILKGEVFGVRLEQNTHPLFYNRGVTGPNTPNTRVMALRVNKISVRP